VTEIYEVPVTTAAPFNFDFPGTMEWTEVRPGFWVGRFDGRLAGVIEERWTGGFIATGREARPLGIHPSLWDAQAAFED
jgi:hypothetical protein